MSSQRRMYLYRRVDGPVMLLAPGTYAVVHDGTVVAYTRTYAPVTPSVLMERVLDDGVPRTGTDD